MPLEEVLLSLDISVSRHARKTVSSITPGLAAKVERGNIGHSSKDRNNKRRRNQLGTSAGSV